MKQYFHIGKLSASTGLKGELILQHKLGRKTNLDGIEAIFLPDGKKDFIPWFPEAMKARTDTEIVIKLEGIDTPEAARKLTPKEVWLSAADFEKHASKSSALSLLGFSIVNGKVALGEIIEVIEQPHQLLCTILYNGKEAMIPIHEGNLQNIDHKSKKVFVELPDGLLDIYS